MDNWLKGKSLLVGMTAVLIIFVYLNMMAGLSNHARSLWSLGLGGLSYLAAHSYKLEFEAGLGGTKKFAYWAWVFNAFVWVFMALMWLL